MDFTITRAEIHPTIGIARVGGSRDFDGFFVGPEVPEELAHSQGAYKDSHGALKRQAAHFRIFGYNAGGEVVAELTPDDAEIEWTLHLANRKVAWYPCDGGDDLSPNEQPLSAARVQNLARTRIR
jgi:hypothetical protein